MGTRELCVMACTFCRQPDFRDYLQAIDSKHELWTEGDAKEFILAACQVASRSELDASEEAGRRFHQLVRIPYLAWRAARAAGQRTRSKPAAPPVAGSNT